MSRFSNRPLKVVATDYVIVVAGALIVTLVFVLASFSLVDSRESSRPAASRPGGESLPRDVIKALANLGYFPDGGTD